MSTTNRNKDNQRSNLDVHWTKIFEHQEKDFRSSSLCSLVQSYIHKSDRVLDAGCGTCALTLLLLKNNVEVLGIDSSPTMVENAKILLRASGFDELRVQCMEIQELASLGREFDVVCALDVLEHIEDDDRAIDALLNVLNENGKLIITVPAISALYGARDVELGHFRRYDERDLRNKLIAHNLDMVCLRYWNLAGYLVTAIMEKLLQKRVNEEFRYKKTFTSVFVNKVLYFWLSFIENKVEMPIGLTLLAVAKKVGPNKPLTKG